MHHSTRRASYTEWVELLDKLTEAYKQHLFRPHSPSAGDLACVIAVNMAVLRVVGGGARQNVPVLVRNGAIRFHRSFVNHQL